MRLSVCTKSWAKHCPPMLACFMLHLQVAAGAGPANTSWRLENCWIPWCSSSKTISTPPRRGKVCGLGWWGDKWLLCWFVCTAKLFSLKLKTQEWHQAQKTVGVCDSHNDSLWLTHFFLNFCAKVKVLPVHPAPQLKVQFCQMALPTLVAAPALAISPALANSKSTPNNPVPWRAHSRQTTSTLGYVVMEQPAKLALVKVHIIGSCACWWVCLCLWMGHAIYMTASRAKVNA